MRITYDDITNRVSIYAEGELIITMFLIDYAKLLGIHAASELTGR